MSEIQEIDVLVLPDGTVKIEVSGVKGQKCLDLTRGLEKALGGNVVVRTHTDAFNEQEQEQDQNGFQGQFG
jgi:hypothetical protein